MGQKAQNIHTHMFPQLKRECYKARGNMHFTFTCRAYEPCLTITRHPVNRYLLNKLNKVGLHSALSVSFIYWVCIPRYRFPLCGKKSSQNKFKTGRQHSVVVKSTGSNPSSTREELGRCGKWPNPPAPQVFIYKIGITMAPTPTEFLRAVNMTAEVSAFQHLSYRARVPQICRYSYHKHLSMGVWTAWIKYIGPPPHHPPHLLVLKRA